MDGLHLVVEKAAPEQVQTNPVIAARLAIAWWNTSLSHPRQDKASEEDMSIAAGVVRLLLEIARVDCLALGEVTADDLDTLRTRSGSSPAFGVVCGRAGQDGRSQDTGIIYRKSRLEAIAGEEELLFTGFADQRYKVALRTAFIVDGQRELLHLFVSHWPSRLWCHQGASVRHSFGKQLADKLDDVRKRFGKDAKIVLAGDFNDEPFDAPLAEQLCATRDRWLATKKDSLLYNPFWRHLGEAHPRVPGKDASNEAGTYYYKGGAVTRWHTFDQIMFSSSFLKGTGWQLNEEATRVLRTPDLAALIVNRETIFDHLPVLGVAEFSNMEEG